MRLPELILLLCLLFLVCFESNAAVARKGFLLNSLFDDAKKKNTDKVPGDGHKCKTFQLGRYLSCSDKKNTSSDDKRVVPTGPNPLHNREEVYIYRHEDKLKRCNYHHACAPRFKLQKA